MAKRDLREFFDEGLEYEHVKSERHPEGKTYRVPSPNAKTGLFLTAVGELGLVAAAGGQLSPSDLEALQLDDDGEKSFYVRVLGSAYTELVEDGVSWSDLQCIGQDAYLCFAMSQDAADAALRIASGKAEARSVPTPKTPRATRPKKAGSSSRKASGATPRRAPNRASTPSSTSPTVPAQEKAAG